MTTNNKECKQCLLNEDIKGVVIDKDGICNHCKTHKQLIPYGEDQLVKIFSKTKKKNKTYDALVPLSGGKDSTYVLFLAVKKYNLKVLCYTFDNGFMSDLAKNNIETAVRKCGADHIWVRYDQAFMHSLYRTSLLQSGEICGICGIGIERAMLKLSEAWKIPLILLGHAPTEMNSFSAENLYDQERLKAILKTNKLIDKHSLKRYLIYPDLNFISTYLYTKLGRFGKKINILFYLDIPGDKEIGNILKTEMDWKEPEQSKYTRHFDCIAEPFSNFIREKRLGYSRRRPQLSNMIRNKEISKEEAQEILDTDKKHTLPLYYDNIKSSLQLTEEDIQHTANIPLNIFNKNLSRKNKLFALVRKFIK